MKLHEGDITIIEARAPRPKCTTNGAIVRLETLPETVEIRGRYCACSALNVECFGLFRPVCGAGSRQAVELARDRESRIGCSGKSGLPPAALHHRRRQGHQERRGEGWGTGGAA